jgi:CRP/FNR family cyclic AMP-dependent transcriptional regulator
MTAKVSKVRKAVLTMKQIQLRCDWKVGPFFKPLSPEALRDFESLESRSFHGANVTLFAEQQTSSRVLVLLEGEVRLSMNSSEGKRLILGVARPGEILGLSSAFSGCPYEVTAETLFPCQIASLHRGDFLAFLKHNPVAYDTVALGLSLDYKRACERLRTLGLGCTSHAKLARLLLEWCAVGKESGQGPHFTVPLTHREIGECIGVSRETVSRTLKEFKRKRLVDFHGSTCVVSDHRGLESCCLT